MLSKLAKYIHSSGDVYRIPLDACRRTIAPVNTPLALTDAKKHLKIFPSDTYNDDEITADIEAVTHWVEGYLGRALITQTWQARLDSFPGHKLALPWSPVQSVTITYVDTSGVTRTVASSVYELVVTDDFNYVQLKYEQDWPADCRGWFGDVTVTWVAGYGDDPEDVPATFRRAIRELVAMNFLNAEGADKLPITVQSLLGDRLMYG